MYPSINETVWLRSVTLAMSVCVCGYDVCEASWGYHDVMSVYPYIFLVALFFVRIELLVDRFRVLRRIHAARAQTCSAMMCSAVIHGICCVLCYLLSTDVSTLHFPCLGYSGPVFGTTAKSRCCGLMCKI